MLKQSSTESFLLIAQIFVSFDNVLQICHSLEEVSDLLSIKTANSFRGNFEKLSDQVIEEGKEAGLNGYFRWYFSFVQLADGEKRVNKLSIVKLSQVILDSTQHLFVLRPPHNLVPYSCLAIHVLGLVRNLLDQGCRDLRRVKGVLCDAEHVESFVGVFQIVLDVVEVLVEGQVFEADRVA